MVGFMDKLWKKAERRFADILGGKRTGPTGKDSPDITHDTLAPEVKTREELPKWFTECMDQAERNAPPGKTPLVIFHVKGERYLDALVVLRLKDFIEIRNDL